MAGSLALHLIVLLIGRWYVTRVTISAEAGSPAPVEFVEISPSAPAAENSKSVVSAAADSSPESASPAEPQSSAIQSFAQNPLPERSNPTAVPAPTPQPTFSTSPQPSGEIPQPAAPTPQPSPTQSVRPRPDPNRSPLPSSPPTNPENSTAPPSDTSTLPRTNPQPETEAPPSGTTPGGSSTSPDAPTDSGGTSDQPAQGSPLEPRSFEVSTRLGSINAPGGGLGELSVRLKQPIESLPLENVPDLKGVRELDLLVGVVIDNATGQVVSITDISSESPTLKAHPEIDVTNIRSVVDQVLLSALFEVERGSAANPPTVSDWNLSIRITLSPLP